MRPSLAPEDLLVAETFGPTVQGEGPSSGQRALFIRLMRCNLICPACDTPYTWDATRFDLTAQARPIAAAQLLWWALGQDAELVVITGGEPLMQQRRLVPLLAGLVQAGRRIEVETNGTISPTPRLLELVAQFNVSPKLAGFGAGMSASRRIKPDALATFAASGRAIFKFVLRTPAELDEVADLARSYDLAPVWVMPEGATAAAITERLRVLADPVIAHGFHLTTRLHVLAWGDQRGR
ncbi:MAG: 7-carboxy-7-deazaguanine synthase QueE [Actinobacteria bacterium]|nr:7-carboxy-7-deazaguanine synthase QueE [Actinomycetota bacterium]MBI3687431.1 7-carboxy-7-deazaguanine synthase QueE [Actinomycetota bacterium]